MDVNYSTLEEWQLDLITEYCKDEMKKLKAICYSVWGKKGIPLSDHDYLYSDAMNVLSESVVSFDPTKNAQFKTFLTNNIKMSFREWCRDNYYRRKRNNLELDENGKIKRDEKKNPIIIPNVSFDAPTEDGIDLAEKIAADYTIEDDIGFKSDSDENVETFLNSLSNVQKNILLMKMDDYSIDEIKQNLNITDKEYSVAMKSIRANDKLSMFAKNINDGNYNTEVSEMSERVMEINEAENYRMDKYSMYSLLDAKRTGDINCKYILQRKPFQWSNEERNRYICRILSNLPIPEIILCEQNIKGMTIAHLIDGLQRLSYAEAFKENRFKVGANGAERRLIQYRDFVLDENGNRILDDDGLPMYELKVCDVVGKTYKDLPDELKKRFNIFNINVTKFFNCTDEQIADHIRDYNNHASMNREQKGMTKISNDTARNIKAIANSNGFFKNCGKFSDNNSIKGKLDRIVTEAIMLLFHRNSWKQDLDKIYQYVDKNATEEQFLELNSDLNRLELALGEDIGELKELFTVSNAAVWLAVYHEFITYGLDDSLFVDFLKAYKNELKEKEINGIKMDSFKDKQTKKKTTVTGKINLLVQLMNEFLHITSKTEEVKSEVGEETNSEVETEELDEMAMENNIVGSTLEFVRENVSDELNEDDIKTYENILDDLTVAVDNNSKLLEQQNVKSMIAIVAYACTSDIDLDDWIVDYFEKNDTYIQDQKENYTYMVDDVNRFFHKENAQEKTAA